MCVSVRILPLFSRFASTLFLLWTLSSPCSLLSFHWFLVSCFILWLLLWSCSLLPCFLSSLVSLGLVCLAFVFPSSPQYLPPQLCLVQVISCLCLQVPVFPRSLSGPCLMLGLIWLVCVGWVPPSPFLFSVYTVLYHWSALGLASDKTTLSNLKISFKRRIVWK